MISNNHWVSTTTLIFTPLSIYLVENNQFYSFWNCTYELIVNSLYEAWFPCSRHHVGPTSAFYARRQNARGRNKHLEIRKLTYHVIVSIFKVIKTIQIMSNYLCFPNTYFLKQSTSNNHDTRYFHGMGITLYFHQLWLRHHWISKQPLIFTSLARCFSFVIKGLSEFIVGDYSQIPILFLSPLRMLPALFGPSASSTRPRGERGMSGLIVVTFVVYISCILSQYVVLHVLL